jgi:hypothetical protein
MKSSLVGTRGRVVVMSIVAVALAGGATYALIPQDGVISACFVKSTGALRVIDATVASCRPGETPLSWNQQGVQGLQGPAGPDGPAGADGADGAPGADGQPGPAVDLVVGKVTLTTACTTFCTGFSFRPEGYTAPVDSQNSDAVEQPIGSGATMSDVTFTLSSPVPAGQGFQVGFTDGTTHHYCQVPSGTSSCSPVGSSTFGGPVRGFIDTSYQENTGKRVTFTWKRTF